MPATSTATEKSASKVSRQDLDELVKECLPSVRFLAARLASRVPSRVDLDDLVQAGMIGLLQSADRFDPERGIKFQTFASRRIQGAMLDYLRSLDWKPRSVRSRNRKLEKACRDAEQRLGGRATEEDVAEEIGISIPELEQWMDESAQLPFLDVWDEPSLKESLDSLADPSDSPEELLAKVQMHDALLHTINRLPKNERLVLSLYYYEQLTMQEIGGVLGVKQARVSQLHGQAILRLRKRLDLINQENKKPSANSMEIQRPSFAAPVMAQVGSSA